MMSDLPPQIYIVDDDPAYAESLKRLIESEGWSAHIFLSASDFFSATPLSESGCILLDVYLPGMNGPEAYIELRARGILLPVIFLTSYGEVTTGVEAIKRGAEDYLIKLVDGEVLLSRIRESLKKHEERMRFEQLRLSVLARFETLTEREKEVLQQVVNGLLNKQISDVLGIAEKTVKKHRGRVMSKMGARTVVELIHVCYQVQLYRHY